MKTTRLVLIMIGVTTMLFAVVGSLRSPDTHLVRQGLFLVAALLLNDLLLAPLFIGVGLIIGRVVPPPYRAVVQGALIVTAAVTFIAVPFLLGFGRQPDLPSALPRNYLGGYAIVLGAIWAVATVVIVWRELRPRRR